MLYYVWLDKNAGDIEHQARRRLQRYKVTRSYMKDGDWKRGRELVECPFSTALNALSGCISDDQKASAWQLRNVWLYEFGWLPENIELFSGYLIKKVDELEFSVRTANCLKNNSIFYVGDLLQKTEVEMLRTPNFGRKSLNEIKEVLAKMGLRLGMEVPDWRPAD